MSEQTFARVLLLSLLPNLVGLTVIPRFDAWLLRQVHRTILSGAGTGLQARTGG